MKCSKHTMLLYAVTDQSWTKEKALYKQIEEALKGGITCLQLREKEMPEEEFLKEAKVIHSLCQNYNVPLIINDNVQIALKADAEGVHIGQDDGDIGQIRKLLGKDKILGVSAHTVEEAEKAQKEGADYLGVGAVFKTSTKKDAKDMPFETLKQICSSVNIPVVAIGGITDENILKLSGSKADGIAVVSAIFSSSDITGTCQKLKKLSEEMIHR